MCSKQIMCLIGPQKADIIRRFLPVFRKARGLRRSPDLEGFFQLALRSAKTAGYKAEDLIEFSETGYLSHPEQHEVELARDETRHQNLLDQPTDEQFLAGLANNLRERFKDVHDEPIPQDILGLLA